MTSHTPGRVRLRIKRDRHQPQLLQDVQGRLEARMGRGSVQAGHTTHSLLVRYDRLRHSRDDMLAVLRDIGLIIGDAVTAFGDELPDLTRDHSTTSDSIVKALSDLDRRLGRRTRHKVDLKILFPLTMVGIGVWQLARRGLGINEVPAYVLLWYGFDSFWKFHHNRTSGSHER